MRKHDIDREYFEWLCSVVKVEQGDVSFKKLLTYLHDTPFEWSVRRDANRAKDGEALRYRFADGYPGSYLERPCSILEMMIALSIRMESFMDDTRYGDRTSQWFWNMVTSLGLGSMMDDRFDEDYVGMVIRRFLKRKYSPDGKGGLFTIRGCERDLRKIEIWDQSCLYLNTIA